jgi:hypothetical protein
VASLRTPFINPEMGYGFLTATQHTSFHSTHHNAVDGAPGKLRELENPFGGGTHLQKFDHKGFNQKSDAVFELGYVRFNDRLKLAGIQMPPLMFAPAVDVSSLGVIRRVCPYLSSLENNFNHHATLSQREVNRLHRLRRLQFKKVFV